MDVLMSAFQEPIACYILDGVLIIYCLIATGLYFKQKLANTSYEEPEEDQGPIYQPLTGQQDADPYQILEPSKRKKKHGKKQKPPAPPDRSRDFPLETMIPGAPGSPLVHH